MKRGRLRREPARAGTKRRAFGAGRRTVFLGAALAGGLGSLALWTVYASPLLEVRTVAVAGAETVEADAVRQAAQVRPGVPLARISADSVRRSVRKLPQVADVAVDRRWPHTLRLTVEERVGVAVLADTTGADARLVDATGFAFPAPSASRPAGLPTLRAEAVAGPAARAQRAAGATVVSSLPATLRSSVNEVDVVASERVRLHLDRGRTVVWGEPSDSARKAEVLAALLSRPARVYDVSIAEVPTTR